MGVRNFYEESMTADIYLSMKSLALPLKISSLIKFINDCAKYAMNLKLTWLLCLVNIRFSAMDVKSTFKKNDNVRYVYLKLMILYEYTMLKK